MPAADIAKFVEQHLTPQRFDEYVADEGRAVLVAEEDGVATGYVMLVHGEPYSAEVQALVRHRPTTELSKIYVLPGAHGRGVARDLLTAAVGIARDIGAAGMWLGTNQANERAQRFYEKSGFVQIGTRRFHVGDRWEEDFVYERALD